MASENNSLPILASWVGGVLVSNDVPVFSIDTQELVETVYKYNITPGTTSDKPD